MVCTVWHEWKIVRRRHLSSPMWQWQRKINWRTYDNIVLSKMKQGKKTPQTSISVSWTKWPDNIRAMQWCCETVSVLGYGDKAMERQVVDCLFSFQITPACKRRQGSQTACSLNSSWMFPGLQLPFDPSMTSNFLQPWFNASHQVRFSKQHVSKDTCFKLSMPHV